MHHTWKGTPYGTYLDTGPRSPKIGVPYGKTERLAAISAVPIAPVKPFAFDPRRIRIDWRLLHSLDIERMVQEVDLDALESCVDFVAFGDVDGEDDRHMSHVNLRRLLWLGQLSTEYLLHVQDTLATDNCQLREAQTANSAHIEALRLRVRELKEVASHAKRESRALAKARTEEQAAALQQADLQHTQRMVDMDRQLAAVREERDEMSREVAHLQETVSRLRDQGPSEISTALAEERRVWQDRLQEALRETREAQHDRLEAKAEAAHAEDLRRQLSSAQSWQRQLQRERDNLKADIAELRASERSPSRGTAMENRPPSAGA
eukprot:jgi/Botrbrau1/10627/Bobra.154_1s0016.1